MSTNQERAEMADDACARFALEQGLDWETEKQEAISDLICDIGHLCNQLGLDYLKIVARSISIHASEMKDPDSIETGPTVTIEIEGGPTVAANG